MQDLNYTFSVVLELLIVKIKGKLKNVIGLLLCNIYTDMNMFLNSDCAIWDNDYHNLTIGCVGVRAGLIGQMVDNITDVICILTFPCNRLSLTQIVFHANRCTRSMERLNAPFMHNSITFNLVKKE